MTSQGLSWFFASYLLFGFGIANGDVPVLKSRSKLITVVDGEHVKPDFWLVMPERNPDIYYVEIPMKAHSVTFRSGSDSITFPVKYGDEHDFVVLLNDNTRCATRIRAVYRKLQPYSRTEPRAAGTEDTIPFRVGDNDKIYVKGKLNGGESLDFQFDLGAGGSLVKKGSEPKANMRFDGTAQLENSSGRNTVPSSSTNRLQLGNLQWEGLPFLVAGNMTRREDGLLGNSLFQDKVLEIDYDLGVMTIHNALPPKAAGYAKHEIILAGVIPFIRGALSMDGELREGWFMFDTGAYTSILYSSKASAASKLLGEFRNMFGANSASGPKIAFGNQAFSKTNYSVQNRDKNDGRLGLLGNDILKRFNVILDNQQGFLYLKPNSLTGQSFRNPEYYLARCIVWGGLLVTAGCVWLVRRGRSKLRPTA